MIPRRRMTSARSLSKVVAVLSWHLNEKVKSNPETSIDQVEVELISIVGTNS